MLVIYKLMAKDLVGELVVLYQWLWLLSVYIFKTPGINRPRSAVGNVSGNRCQSDCRYRGREFDPSWPGPIFSRRL